MTTTQCLQQKAEIIAEQGIAVFINHTVSEQSRELHLDRIWANVKFRDCACSEAEVLGMGCYLALETE